MEYGKNLIILKGERGAKALTIENSAHGTFCKLKLDKKAGEKPYFCIKDGARIFAVSYDGQEFSLPFVPEKEAHYMVIDAKDYQPVLYGTLSRQPLFAANITDGVTEYVKTMERGKKKIFYDTEKKTEEKVSPKTPDYDDEAIAQENFYPREFGKTAVLQSAPPQRAMNGFIETKPVRHLKNYRSHADFSEKAEGLSREVNLNAKRAEEKLSERQIKTVPRIQKDGAQKIAAEKADFYLTVKAKLEKLFEKGERFEVLEKRIPFTRWVKIPYERTGYYVVGTVGDKPEYIAYGVPGRYAVSPPEEMGKDCAFAPIDAQNPEGEGLWLLYQDAKTGESVALAIQKG